MLSWLNHLYRHDIGVTEIPPYPVHAVSCFRRSCCDLTAPSPPAVWHLQEGKWVHYLIAISTSVHFIHLHANGKQESPPRYPKRQITFICICLEILTNRSSPLSFVFMLFFFLYYVCICADSVVPRVTKHAQWIISHVNIQHGWKIKCETQQWLPRSSLTASSGWTNKNNS